MLKVLGQLSKGLRQKSVIAFFLSGQAGYLAANWFLVIMKELGYGTNISSYIFSVRVIVAFLVMAVLVLLQKHLQWQKFIWFGLIIITVLSSLTLLVGASDPLLFIISGIVCLSALKSLVSMTGTDALTGTVQDEMGSSRMMLLMVIVPILQFILLLLAGWLTSYYKYAVYGIVTMMAMCLLFQSAKYKAFNHIDLKRTHEPIVSKLKLMVCLSTTQNFFGIVISFVLIPLYIFETSNGSFLKFGFWLGVLSLVGLMGKFMKNQTASEDEKLNRIILFFSVAVMNLSVLGWGIMYDHSFLPLVFIAVRQFVMPLWNASFYSTMKEFAADAHQYSEGMRLQITMNRLVMALSYFLAGYVFLDQVDLYNDFLIFSGISAMISFGIIFVLLRRF